MNEGTIRNSGFTLDPTTDTFVSGRVLVPGVNHVEISRGERETALARHQATRHQSATVLARVARIAA